MLNCPATVTFETIRGRRRLRTFALLPFIDVEDWLAAKWKRHYGARATVAVDGKPPLLVVRRAWFLASKQMHGRI